MGHIRFFLAFFAALGLFSLNAYGAEASFAKSYNESPIVSCKTQDHYGAYDWYVFYQDRNLVRRAESFRAGEPRWNNFYPISQDNTETVYAMGYGSSNSGTTFIKGFIADIRKVRRTGDRMYLRHLYTSIKEEVTCEVIADSQKDSFDYKNVPYDYHTFPDVQDGLTEMYVNGIYNSCFSEEMERAASKVVKLKGVSSSIDATRPTHQCFIITSNYNDDITQPMTAPSIDCTVETIRVGSVGGYTLDEFGSAAAFGTGAEYGRERLTEGLTLIHLSMLEKLGIPSLSEFLSPSYLARQNGRDSFANAWISGPFFIPKVELGKISTYAQAGWLNIGMYQRPFKIIQPQEPPTKKLSLRNLFLPTDQRKTSEIDFSNERFTKCLDTRLNNVPPPGYPYPIIGRSESRL